LRLFHHLVWDRRLYSSTVLMLPGVGDKIWEIYPDTARKSD